MGGTSEVEAGVEAGGTAGLKNNVEAGGTTGGTTVAQAVFCA